MSSALKGARLTTPPTRTGKTPLRSAFVRRLWRTSAAQMRRVALFPDVSWPAPGKTALGCRNIQLVHAPASNPLVGTWGSLDDDGTSVEYRITQARSGLAVSAVDTHDGEAGIVSNVAYDGSTLTFSARGLVVALALLCAARHSDSDPIHFHIHRA